MTADIVIRHAVSITGQVTDALSGSPLAGARVEITQGPAEFESERIDQTFSHADGVYYFLDLPSGTYHLKFSLPQAGRRYGDFQADSTTTLGQRDTAGRIMITIAQNASQIIPCSEPTIAVPVSLFAICQQ